MTRDHPLLGVGVGNFSAVEPVYALRDIDLLRPEYVIDRRLGVHNTYLEMASELGTVGLLLFAAVVSLALLAGLRAVRRFEQLGDADGEDLVRGLVLAAVGLLAAYAFLSGIFEKQLWLLLGVIVGMLYVAERQQREPAR